MTDNNDLNINLHKSDTYNNYYDVNLNFYHIELWLNPRLSCLQYTNLMKTLTEISIVLTIPTIIYGFWGVNVKLPFEGMAFGFLLVLAVSLIISGVVWFWMRRMKFL